MKLILVFVAVLGFAAADDLSDLKLFLQCLHKAIEEGIPSIPIPPHNPLHIRDFSATGGNALVGEWTLSAHDNILYNLLDYTFTNLEVVATSSNPDMVEYGYDIFWSKLNFTGNWEIDIKFPLYETSFKGTYNVVLQNLNWFGIFNLTKPGQEGVKETVNDFTLSSSLYDSEVELTGVAGAGAIQETLEFGLWTLLNNFPESAAEFLRTERFNGFWLDHPERIRATMEFCGLV